MEASLVTVNRLGTAKAIASGLGVSAHRSLLATSAFIVTHQTGALRSCHAHDIAALPGWRTPIIVQLYSSQQPVTVEMKSFHAVFDRFRDAKFETNIL